MDALTIIAFTLSILFVIWIFKDTKLGTVISTWMGIGVDKSELSAAKAEIDVIEGWSKLKDISPLLPKAIANKGMVARWRDQVASGQTVIPDPQQQQQQQQQSN